MSEARHVRPFAHPQASPSAHGAQPLAAASILYVPVRQLLHSAAPSRSLKVPHVQLVQLVALTPLKVPHVQLVQLVALTPLKVPHVQLLQLVAPVLSLNEPAGQGSHDCAPS